LFSGTAFLASTTKFVKPNITSYSTKDSYSTKHI